MYRGLDKYLDYIHVLCQVRVMPILIDRLDFTIKCNFQQKPGSWRRSLRCEITASTNKKTHSDRLSQNTPARHR